MLFRSLPQLRTLIVVANGWVSDREFADLFALSQIMPGPNFIFMLSLIGWQIGGLLGAIAATLGIAGPPCTAMFFAFRLWHRFRDARWRQIVSRGIVPLTIGLVIAGGYVMARAGDPGWPAAVVTAGAVVLMLRTRINPLWILTAGGVLGAFGFV